MNEIDLRHVDLNLLVSLHALLETESVTRAARRVGMSQSSMSHALGRLRELFEDPLLVRQGRGLVTTPRARALHGPLQSALRDLQHLLRAEPAFDPRTSTRAFTLICPDALGSVVPALLAALQREAPRVSVRLRTPQRDLAEALEDAVGDLALSGPYAPTSSLKRQGLGALSWVVLRRRDHPVGHHGPLTAAQWTRWPHILLETGNDSPNIVAEAIRRAGLDRTIGAVLPSFLMAAHVVSRSDHFLTAARALAEPLRAPLDLIVSPPPIALDPIPVTAIWPERLDHDPGHLWFRTVIIDTARALMGQTDSAAR